jgi:hypothetical protein
MWKPVRLTETRARGQVRIRGSDVSVSQFVALELPVMFGGFRTIHAKVHNEGDGVQGLEGSAGISVAIARKVVSITKKM